MPAPSSTQVRSVRALEGILGAYPRWDGPRLHTVEIERFPLMVPIFRALVDRGEGRPPEQSEFTGVVMSEMRNAGALDAVAGRLSRTYAALMAQYHAFLALREHYPLVIWDNSLDVERGVDLLVFTSDGLSVGLALRSASQRSVEAEVRKQARRGGLPFVVVTVALRSGNNRTGSFDLYAPSDLFAAVDEAAHRQRFEIAGRYFDEGYEARCREEEREAILT